MTETSSLPGKRRAVVLLVLHDGEGRYLLQHRDENAPTYPGYWGFFGGGVEGSESPDAAMRREAFEELRYALKDPVSQFSICYEDPKTGRTGTKYYFSELCTDWAELELHEGQG